MLNDLIFFSAGFFTCVGILWAFLTFSSPERYDGYGPKFNQYRG